MKKAYLTYLRRIIGIVIAGRDSDHLSESVLSIKTPSSGSYQIMRDIVCDARFYSVMENDTFWKTYGAYKIGKFMDSLTSEEWNDDAVLTMMKEDFLSGWMSAHMLPLSDDRRTEIKSEIKLSMQSDDSIGFPDPDEHDGTSLGIINLGNGIKDATNHTGEPAEGLPPNLKDYMDDAIGGASPDLHNDGHSADAHFLNNIDRSIVMLAEKIGRRSEDHEPVRSRFKPAPKSDISGVTVGNDLNSLLPSELALLSSPSSEKIFLDRYARKRLQIFSSFSESRNEKMKSGPIYICIDTSGSMVGEPEVLAKTLTLAISIIAQRERRPVCIFNYSDKISFFVLNDLKTQRRKLLRFLSESYGGGNNENKLFSFIFSKMSKHRSYRRVAIELKGADLLVISDFMWTKIEEDTAELIDTVRQNGLRIFTIAMQCDADFGIRLENETEMRNKIKYSPGYRSGFGFYIKSDFPHTYEGGKIKEDRF